MLSLSSNHVDVWYWNLSGVDCTSYLAEAQAMMSDQEKQRRARIQRPAAKEAFGLSRFFLRTCLSKYSAAQPHEWRFSHNEHGKPVIARPRLETALHFNLSHTSDCMTLAVATSAPVGVDIENTNRRTSLLQTANRFYSPTEVAVLQSLQPAEQRRRFFEYWTLREAYVKARGLAIAVLFKHLCFEIRDAGDITLRPVAALDDQIDRWHFEIIWPSSTHCMAVAIAGAGSTRPIIAVHKLCL